MSDAFNTDSQVEHRSGKVPALGLSWSNAVTTRLMLARTDHYVTLALHDNKAASPQPCKSSANPRTYEANVRNLRALFAPHLPNSVLCRFIVDEDGVKGLPE